VGKKGTKRRSTSLRLIAKLVDGTSPSPRAGEGESLKKKLEKLRKVKRSEVNQSF
jgi:hypothetical protein